MESVNQLIQQYTAQVRDGLIPKAYRAILSFMSVLRSQLADRYPDFSISALYKGTMDMTYFTLTPPELSVRQLKIALVYLHEQGRFEIWLAGQNRQIQAQYIDLLGRYKINRYNLSQVKPGVDSIIEYILDEQPDFDHGEALAAKLTNKAILFCQDISFYLNPHITVTDEGLARSLTAESTELITFLPYLLQDLWELGSSPEVIADLLLKNARITNNSRILDLACGKGAVSIALARTFRCLVKGIDLMPAFIVEAIDQAAAEGVAENCEFIVGDIDKAVESENGYDVVIYGAAGDALGESAAVLKKLKRTIKPDGLIVIDDAYARHETDSAYLTRDQWLSIIAGAGLKLVDEQLISDTDITSINDEQQALIAKRVYELKQSFPEKESLFEGYLQSQLAECDDLTSKITGVTLLLACQSGLHGAEENQPGQE